MPFKVKKLTPIKTDSLPDLGQGVLDLAKYVEDEFGEVAKTLLGTEADHIWNSAPPKPRRGTYAYADGTNWNPGNGEGPYYFDTAWRTMKGAAGLSTDAPSDGTVYGRRNGAWVNVLSVTGGQTLTGGFNLTPNNLGTITSGTVTPNPLLGNYQYYTNNGAHTLAAPTSDCAMDILITNGASAGAITFSGFTVGTNIGDALTTTSTNKFIISLRRINAIATYTIKALQ